MKPIENRFGKYKALDLKELQHVKDLKEIYRYPANRATGNISKVSSTTKKDLVLDINSSRNIWKTGDMKTDMHPNTLKSNQNGILLESLIAVSPASLVSYNPSLN